MYTTGDCKIGCKFVPLYKAYQYLISTYPLTHIPYFLGWISVSLFGLLKQNSVDWAIYKQQKSIAQSLEMKFKMKVTADVMSGEG